MNLLHIPLIRTQSNRLGQLTINPMAIDWNIRTTILKKDKGQSRLQKNCHDEVMISDKDNDHEEKFIKMLTDFSSLYDGQLGMLQVSKHYINLIIDRVFYVHSVLHRSGSNAQTFAVMERYKMLQEELIEPAMTEWNRLIIYEAKKECSLWFCEEFQELKFKTVCDFYSWTKTEECSNALDDGADILTLGSNSGSWGRLKLDLKTEGRWNLKAMTGYTSYCKCHLEYSTHLLPFRK